MAKMQIDVTANLTLEVDEDDLRDYALGELYDVEEDELEEGFEEEYLEEFVTSVLEGEEISTYGGRAWVCAVDDCSVLW